MGPDSPQRGIETGDSRRNRPSGSSDLRPGAILGGRYRMESPLGRGGMGEVWHAFDLKLRVEVALKFLLPEVRDDPGRLEMLRREVRSARDVISPHVCRIFDLVEIDGQEVISMEYVEGTTLREVLEGRSPLALAEAHDLAAQMLSGLQAIHEAGLVHRDLKPDNLMLSRAGRLILLDFGLAKNVQETQSLAVAGTPAYMAPEQLRGGGVGPRSDVFAAGMVLAEMVHAPGVRSLEALQQLWDGLRRDPPAVEAGPWAETIRRALAAEAGERFATAAELSRALGEGHAPGREAEDLNPYPGLASYTGDQARFFFGREVEVEQTWRKLQQLSMLAIIGPSGVGKTSFLQAGLFEARPEGWRIVHCTPGDAPFVSLAQALVPELSGRTEDMRELMRLDDGDRSLQVLRRWREGHRQALVVVDQFEELFTLNAPEVQERFANLLGRLAIEADVRVLVAMRDDFFFHCHGYPMLHPLFSEPSPLAPLEPADLRRALVQPARLCGYEFESESMVEEMIAEVEGERGALPLLAFAAASLWGRRDRERGVIPLRAYEDIGRVEGALAQHAERTLERIGPSREELVREIFRNLVTAQATRVIREREDLLSVFEERGAAAEVLDALIDARLLISFEVQAEGGGERRRVEIVHESLLRSWPRLVRWQTQDADGAQLRDQLRQAARLWEQRARSDDLLWTGTAYREFELWRDRYPGRVSDTEEGFAAAMRSRERRRRRRRRVAVAGAFAALLAVLGVVGWLGRRAALEAKASEAQRLAMLAEETLTEDNTVALALATASLERSDVISTRLTALRALWLAPVRWVLTTPDTLAWYSSALLSPDGQWLATTNEDGVLLWPRDGGEPTRLESEPSSPPFRTLEMDFHPSGRYLVARRRPQSTQGDFYRPGRIRLTLWSVPEGERLRTWDTSLEGQVWLAARGDPCTVYLHGYLGPEGQQQWYRFEMASDAALPLELPPEEFRGFNWRNAYVDAKAERVLCVRDEALFETELTGSGLRSPVPIARRESPLRFFAIGSREDRVASTCIDGSACVWSRDGPGPLELLCERPLSSFDPGMRCLDAEGRRVVFDVGNDATRMGLLDLGHPLAQPMLLGPNRYFAGATAFTPDGAWLVYSWFDTRFGPADQVFFHSLRKSRPAVYRVAAADQELRQGFFTHDGGVVIASNDRGEFYRLEVETEAPDARLLWTNPAGRAETFGLDDARRHILVNGFASREAWLVSPDDGAAVDLGRTEGLIGGLALSGDGRRAAVAGSYAVRTGVPDEPRIRLLDLGSGEERVLEGDGESGFYGVHFLPGNRLVSHGHDGLYLWNLESGEYEVISRRSHHGDADLHPSGGLLLVDTPEGLTLWDLERREERLLPIPSAEIACLALAPDTSFVVVGQPTGGVLVLDLRSEDSHLLLGHEGVVLAVWVSPDSREIHSLADDGTVRVWQRPRGRPVHDLPHDEFLAFLRGQTNLRAVPDVEAEEGYRIIYDEFPGWETSPDW